MKQQRRFLTKGVVLGVVLALLIAGVALAATITIDDFSAGRLEVAASPPATDSDYIDTATVLGDQRDMSVTGVSGEGGYVRLDVWPTAGKVNFSEDPGISGTGYIHWDGMDDDAATLDPYGLDHQDLTDGGTNDGFLLRVIFDDWPMTVTMKVYTGTNWSQYVIAMPGDILSETVDFFVPFSDFSVGGGTGAVFTDTGAVVLEFDGTLNPGTDLNATLFSATSARDFGDLPDTYSTTLSANGPRHITASGLRLGAGVDTEADGNASASGDGDDTDGVDDEDGVVYTPGVNWQVGSDGASVDVTVNGCSGTCYLSAWFDWARNDNFSDSGDQVLDDYAITNGEHTITFDIPSACAPPKTSATHRSAKPAVARWRTTNSTSRRAL